MPSIRRPSQGPSPIGPDFRFNPVPRSTESPAGGTGNWFVWSGAVGSGTGLNWLNAFTTLTAALAVGAVGHTFWVAHDHAESTAAAVTLTSPGSTASPCRIICVVRTGSILPVSADLRDTASVSTTGANALSFGGGSAYWYGIDFNSGSAGNTANINFPNASPSFQTFKLCSFNLTNTSTSSRITITGIGSGLSAVSTVWEGCTVSFGSTSQGFSGNGSSATFQWRDTASAIQGATIPTTLFLSSSPITQLTGVDLSASGAGKAIFAASTIVNRAVLLDCKIGGSVTVSSTPTAPPTKIDLIRCDSGDTNYRCERYAYEGTLTTETTIVRTGGASDGTTPASRKIATTANSKWQQPFESFPMAVWNETTGSAVTVTVEAIWGSAWPPSNSEIWIEVEYLGTSGVPLGSFATSGTADVLAAGTPYTASSEVWGGSTTAFKMSVSVTPQEKGPITIRVMAAKASATYYYDHKPTLS